MESRPAHGTRLQIFTAHFLCFLYTHICTHTYVCVCPRIQDFVGFRAIYSLCLHSRFLVCNQLFNIWPFLTAQTKSNKLPKLKGKLLILFVLRMVMNWPSKNKNRLELNPFKSTTQHWHHTEETGSR